MAEKSIWMKHGMACPEGRGHAELFLEWQAERGEEVLNSICCNNPQLRDLSGSDCGWSCWDKIMVARKTSD
jgi:hypothetical protein